MAAFDHLGRARAATAETLELSSAPVYLLFAADSLEKFARDLPPAPAARLGGAPSPVVIQAVWPQQRVALFQSAYRISADKPEQIPIFVYNFGSKPVEGRLSVVAPKGWKLSLPGRISVQPGQRMRIGVGGGLAPSGVASLPAGDYPRRFPVGGHPVLSLRLFPETH